MGRNLKVLVRAGAAFVQTLVFPPESRVGFKPFKGQHLLCEESGACLLEVGVTVDKALCMETPSCTPESHPVNCICGDHVRGVPPTCQGARQGQCPAETSHSKLPGGLVSQRLTARGTPPGWDPVSRGPRRTIPGRAGQRREGGDASRCPFPLQSGPCPLFRVPLPRRCTPP